MARYGLIWLEIAHDDYTSLSDQVRALIRMRIEQLLENPRHTGCHYDELTDSFTTAYGGGVGLIVYAVVHERQRLIILRLVLAVSTPPTVVTAERPCSSARRWR